jgi:hypothetical protein
MKEDFDKRNVAIVLRYILTPGGKYVSLLESNAVLRNSRQAHQEHLRLWARMMKCKEVHLGFSDKETYVFSYSGGYRTKRTFEFGGFNAKPRLLDIERVRYPLWRLKYAEGMKFCPKHDDEWRNYESGYDYKSRPKTITVVPETANVHTSVVETYSFPMLQQVGEGSEIQNEGLNFNDVFWISRYRID